MKISNFIVGTLKILPNEVVVSIGVECRWAKNWQIGKFSRFLSNHTNLLSGGFENSNNKGPVKLILRVKIAHSFSQSVSNLFHFIILSLYIWVSKDSSEPTSKNGEIGRFNRSSLIEAILADLEI